MKAIGRHLLSSLGLFCLIATISATSAQSVKIVAEPIEEIPIETPPAPEDAIPESLQKVPQVAADAVPETGTFHSGQHVDDWPPLPANLNNLPCWDLGDGIFLVNDFGFDYAAVSVEAQIKPIAKGGGGMMLMGLPGFPPDDGGTNSGGGGGSYFITYNTNQLWLELTNVVANVADVNLHHGTNLVYAIWSTTNLPGGWQVETEVWPTNADCMPFTVPMLNRTNLFLRAQDWTGVDAGTNGLLDWWEWKYFGNFNQSPTNDYDSDGVNNGTEYTNSIDPNKIVFTLSVTNNYVTTSYPTVALNVSNGVPSYCAVLVDSTNFFTATWQAYTATPTVYLGPTQGWHDVWIGLRGLPADAAQSWQWQRLKLDTTPPLLVITSPTNSTVTQPMIQLLGYSPEALTGISYDLTNAAGWLTNQQVLITKQSYSTNTWELTTNTFQAFDVALTNGVNTFTLHATDLTGNVTTTNFSFTLDYTGKTNPPAVQLLWPKDGLKISGSNFTWHGLVADFTAKVSAAITSTNGQTNLATGVVERDGNFWVKDLPLNPGTNRLTLTVRDAAGNVGTTNISIVQSAVTLTMNPVTDDLWQNTITVSGTTSATNNAVSVNGVAATITGNTWTATNVPMTAGGKAIFVVAGEPGATPQINITFDKSDKLGTDSDTQNLDWTTYSFFTYGSGSYSFQQTWRSLIGQGWEDGVGGTGSDVEHADQTEIGGNYFGSGIFSKITQSTWVPAEWPAYSYGTNLIILDDWDEDAGQSSPVGPPGINQEHCDVQFIAGTSWAYNGGDETDQDLVTYHRQAQTTVKLLTGGAAVPGHESLFVFTGTATELITRIATVPPIGGDTTFGFEPHAIPPEQITIGALGNLDTNGVLYAVLPDGDPDVTPKAKKNNYTFTLNHQKYTPVSLVKQTALTDSNLRRTTLGVGEEVDLAFDPTLPEDAIWTTSAGSLTVTNGLRTTLTAPSNATANVTVTATLRGKTVHFPAFKVVEPTGIDHAQIIGTNHYSIGAAGAGSTNYIWAAPTSVSFYRVWLMEIGKVATNATGYFANTNVWPVDNLDHSKRGANKWFQLLPNNEYGDWASSGTCNPPWSSGGHFTWQIPVVWQVGGTNTPSTNCPIGWNQNQDFSIDSSGTVTVQKFGHSMTRTTNDIINAN